MFEKGYTFESEKFIADSFKKVFKSILQAGELRRNRISKQEQISNKVNIVSRVFSQQGYVEKSVFSKEINQEQSHKLQKDNIVRFKNPNQLDKVKRILGEKKKQKSSWIRRLVSW